ncbi:hypothetical protein ACEWPM_015725 [Roseovarius sp. S4756]|uniref:hypothetical protein n=1 Tax=Roseovarius maritimus TaxID=3342637 RepID=UPI003729CBB4
MTQDPEDRIQDDLTLATAWCEHLFPGERPILLFAACQKRAEGIGMLMADYSSHIRRDCPVVDVARWSMEKRGHYIEWIPGVEVLFILSVSSVCLSEHERIAAIQFFSPSWRASI